MTTRAPEFLWAQRKDKIFLTINVPDVRKGEAEVKMEDAGRVYFRGVSGDSGETYEVDLMLLKPINVAESKYNIGARTIEFKIAKAESGPYWETLLKTGKNIHCKVDWDHWKDEDEPDDDKFGASWDSKDSGDLDFGDDDESSADETTEVNPENDGDAKMEEEKSTA